MKDKPYFAAFGSEIRFIKGLCKKPLACYFADESGKSLFEQPDKILNEGCVKSCFCQQMQLFTPNIILSGRRFG
jgi:hypothetical protein